jgi:hypothetical protein
LKAAPKIAPRRQGQPWSAQAKARTEAANKMRKEDSPQTGAGCKEQDSKEVAAAIKRKGIKLGRE